MTAGAANPQSPMDDKGCGGGRGCGGREQVGGPERGSRGRHVGGSTKEEPHVSHSQLVGYVRPLAIPNRDGHAYAHAHAIGLGGDNGGRWQTPPTTSSLDPACCQTHTSSSTGDGSFLRLPPMVPPIQLPLNILFIIFLLPLPKRFLPL